MRNRIIVTLALALAFALAAPAQMQPQGGYLDVFIAKVKPEKRAEFDAAAKRVTEANRRNNGDKWIASEVIYGDWNTFYFSSARQNYGEAEKALNDFFGALAKAAGGPAGGAKIMQDMNNCLINSRAELRRRRLDLSSNFPADPTAYARWVGEARWLRTVIVRVRPGHQGDYEQAIQMIRTARERTPGGRTLSVSQSVAGQTGSVFYLTSLAKGLADFDAPLPPLPQLLGQDGYQKFIRMTGEATFGTEILIQRFVPEISNPPDEVVAAAPDFWKPKPAAAPKPKAKTAAPTGGSK